MDRERQSEMISAYLDGELTPSERMDAERLLENSPELREELNDFARLSDLLRALPREEAPTELASAIRREAERKSLLGPEPAAPRRSYLRELVVAVSAMAATALGMLLLPQESLRRDVVATRAPMEAKLAMESAPAGWASDETASEQLIASISEADSAPASSAPVSEAAAAPLAMRAIAPGAPPPPPKHEPEIAEALAGVNLNQNSVSIGDVVPYFQNGVGVVVVTVVDANLDFAGDRMAVLLEKNGLSVQPGDNSKRSQTREAVDGKSEKTTRTLDRDPQMMLVYIDASQQTVTQVLNEMAAEQLFAHAKLQPPVDAPELTNLDLFDADGTQREGANKPKDGEVLAEEVITNNAVAAIENYVSRQLAEQPAREGTFRIQAGKEGQVVDRRAGQQAKGLSTVARNRKDANAPADDSPAGASTAQNTVGVAARKQNGAAVVRLNANNLEVLDKSVMVEQQKLAGRDSNVDKAKAVESKKADALSEREELRDESAAERTVRLLVVLQSNAVPTP